MIEKVIIMGRQCISRKQGMNIAPRDQFEFTRGAFKKGARVNSGG